MFQYVKQLNCDLIFVGFPEWFEDNTCLSQWYLMIDVFLELV